MITRTLLTAGLCALLAGNVPSSNVSANQTEVVVSENQAQEKNDLAVLLIDMQEPFLEMVNQTEFNEELAYQQAVLDYCKDNNVPVIVVNFRDQGPLIPELKYKVDQLKFKDEVIKPSVSGFHDTDLNIKLIGMGIKRVLLMGVYASACVRGTAEDAVERNYQIMASTQLMADHETFGNNESIEWYKRHGIYADNYKDLLRLIE